MGKISSYTSVTTQSTDDLLICDQDVGGTLTTMKTTVGKVGTAVAEVQTHAALDTTNKTIVGAINEVGSLPDTASGSIATFTTSLEKPLVECECEIPYKASGYANIIINHLNDYPMTDWLGIKKVVQAGLAPQAYPIGTEFTVQKTLSSSVVLDQVFRVVDYDYAMPDGLEHSMVLENKFVYSNKSNNQVGIQFDGPEAFYYCENGLTAGTYTFNWTYAGGQITAGDYQFTITQDIPSGGQIVIGTNSNSTALTSCKITTYSSVGSTTPLESNIVITSGNSGTSLGTTNPTNSSDTNLNCCQRIMWGSNNYAQSAMRQWLNSNSSNGGFWTAQTKFDRPSSWASSSDVLHSGYKKGLPDDFLNAIHTAKIPCRTNKSGVMEVNSLNGDTYSSSTTYNLSDDFFLLSRPEIYGTWDSSSLKDGKLLDYYDGLSQSDLIKRDKGGTARACWLRSPYPDGASYVRFVRTDGSLSYGNADGAIGAAPACLIG